MPVIFTNIENLPMKDRIFMLVNQQYFPIDIKGKIRFMSNDLTQLINQDENLSDMYTKEKMNASEILSIVNSMGEFKNRVSDFVSLPCSSKDELIECFKSLYYILSEMYKTHSQRERTKQLIHILNHKLEAFNIGCRLYNYNTNYSNTIRDLLNALLQSVDNRAYASFIISLLKKALTDLNDSDITTSEISLALNDISKLMYALISDNRIEDINDVGNTSIIEYLRMNKDELPDDIYNFLSSPPETKSFSTDLLSMKGKNSNIDITPNIEIFLKDIKENDLKDFVGIDNRYEFMIPESIIGYILSKSNFDVGKVFIKDKGMCTLISDNDDIYLLFYTNEKPDKCFGIECKKTRNDLDENFKLMEIECPLNTSYKLI